MPVSQQLLNKLNATPGTGIIRTLGLRVSWREGLGSLLGQLQYLPSSVVVMLGGKHPERGWGCV